MSKILIIVSRILTHNTTLNQETMPIDMGWRQCTTFYWSYMVTIFSIIPLALQNSSSFVSLCTGNLSKNNMQYTSPLCLICDDQNTILPTKWRPLLTCSRPRFPLCSHSLVRGKNNSQFVGIKPQLKKDLFKLYVVWKI